MIVWSSLTNDGSTYTGVSRGGMPLLAVRVGEAEASRQSRFGEGGEPPPDDVDDDEGDSGGRAVSTVGCAGVAAGLAAMGMGADGVGDTMGLRAVGGAATAAMVLDEQYSGGSEGWTGGTMGGGRVRGRRRGDEGRD